MKNYKLASLCMISITILIEDKEYNRNTISYTTTFCNFIGLEHTYTRENYKTFAKISLAVFMPNIITDHAITYTYTMMAKPIRALELHYPTNQFLIT